MDKQYGQEMPRHDERGTKPFRCLCSSMLARLVPGGVELKCRRCKRQVIVPLEENKVGKMVRKI
ncbi:MAG TPA: hypothetical protein VEG60_10695 [Candidatus Binatia bacterium]|nr:hypothetical protein [Candidatus Binatia bacterium]